MCEGENWCSNRWDSTLQRHTCPASLMEPRTTLSRTEKRSLEMAAYMWKNDITMTSFLQHSNLCFWACLWQRYDRRGWGGGERVKKKGTILCSREHQQVTGITNYSSNWPSVALWGEWGDKICNTWMTKFILKCIYIYVIHITGVLYIYMHYTLSIMSF